MYRYNIQFFLTLYDTSLYNLEERLKKKGETFCLL